LAGLGEDLAKEGGGQGFDRLKPGLGRRTGFLHRRHLFAQHPRNALLLGQWRKGKSEIKQFVSFHSALPNPSIADRGEDSLLPLMVQPTCQEVRQQGFSNSSQPCEMVAVDYRLDVALEQGTLSDKLRAVGIIEEHIAM
jgi:hypothetical protein